MNKLKLTIKTKEQIIRILEKKGIKHRINEHGIHVHEFTFPYFLPSNFFGKEWEVKPQGNGYIINISSYGYDSKVFPDYLFDSLKFKLDTLLNDSNT